MGMVKKLPTKTENDIRYLNRLLLREFLLRTSRSAKRKAVKIVEALAKGMPEEIDYEDMVQVAFVNAVLMTTIKYATFEDEYKLVDCKRLVPVIRLNNK